jgi:hypothetical protein
VKLCVSFSGGKTSGYMARWCQENARALGYTEVIYVFANTGREHESTLDFVQRCDREWALGVVWLEAEVMHGQKLSAKHRVVDYDSAARGGEPFEQVIRKYGIPNKSYPHCTRELKLNPIRSYLKHLGWWGEHHMAVGIRVDEIDRMQADAREKRIVYPLIKWRPMDRAAIDRFWDRQPFTLDIESIYGNCVTCWKKSERKLKTLARRDHTLFAWDQKMESLYGLAGHNEDGTPRTFFREGRSADDIIAMSRMPFAPWTEERELDLFADQDTPDGCSDSCEVTW